MTIFRRTFWATAIAHISLLLIFVLVPFIIKIWKRPKPNEIVTYVDIQPAPQVLQPPPEKAETQPTITTPEPVQNIPEPPKKKPKRKKIEKSKKRIRREPKTPPPKELTPEQIKELLATEQPTTTKPRPTKTTLPSWYYALVRQTVYESWAQPSELSAEAGLSVLISIRVAPDGSILERKMIRASNVHSMDSSAMKAVESITSLKPLPPQFKGKHEDITINFELTDN